jgi:hypothetical protein
VVNEEPRRGGAAEGDALTKLLRERRAAAQREQDAEATLVICLFPLDWPCRAELAVALQALLTEPADQDRHDGALVGNDMEERG